MKKTDFIIGFVLFALISAFHLNLSAQKSLTDSLYQELERAKSDSSRLYLMNVISYKLAHSHQDSAMNLAEETFQYAKSVGMEGAEAKSLKNMGVIYWYKGEYEHALDAYKAAAEIFQKLGLQRNLSNCRLGIATIYGMKGDYPAALDFFQAALKGLDTINDREIISSCYTNIGIVHKKLKNYELALQYYSLALRIASLIDDEYGIGQCLLNMGVIRMEQKDFNTAKDYFIKALEINQKHNKGRSNGICLTNLGDLYHRQKQWDSAAYFYKRSIRFNQETKNSKSLAIALNNMGRLFLDRAIERNQRGNHKTNLDSSLFFLDSALNLSRHIGVLSIEIQAIKNFSLAYETQGKLTKALDYCKLTAMLRDSLFGIEKIKSAEQLEARYQFRNKMLEIETLKKDRLLAQNKINHQQVLIWSFAVIGFVILGLLVFIYWLLQEKNRANKKLHSSNKLISQTNEELKTQRDAIEKYAQELEEINATRDQLYSIIAHDLKGPFNALLGFSDILLTDWNSTSEKERTEMIQMINKSAAENYSLLLNLLEWSRFQSGRVNVNKTDIDLDGFLNAIKAQLSPSAELKSVVLRFSADKYLRLKTDEAMLGTVLRNLISNAIKFTAQNGEVTVSVSQEKEKVLIKVKDSGVGMTEQQQKDLFAKDAIKSTSGTEGEAGTGLGLKICREFIEKLGGTLSLESKVDEGSCFSIRLNTAVARL